MYRGTYSIYRVGHKDSRHNARIEGERRYPAHYDKTYHRPRMFPVRFSHVFTEISCGNSDTHTLPPPLDHVCKSTHGQWFDTSHARNGHIISRLSAMQNCWLVGTVYLARPSHVVSINLLRRVFESIVGYNPSTQILRTDKTTTTSSLKGEGGKQGGRKGVAYLF